MTQVTLKTIEQNDNVGMFSICFDGNSESNKRDSEISKWLTGRHNFTTQTIARIETALGSKLISIAH